MRLRLFTGAAAMLFACMPALATPISISPGKTVTPGTGSFGGQKIDTITHTAAGGSLTYTDTVYADPNNPICTGCYEFVLNVTYNGLFSSVTAVSEADFNGDYYTLMVGYKDNRFGVSPTSVTESANGNKVTFQTDLDFFNDTSDPLIIYTNAMQYTSGDITFATNLLIDPPGLVPSGPAMTGVTPEPSSLLLLSTGLMGAAGMLRRRMVRA